MAFSIDSAVSLREAVYPKLLAERSPSEPVRVWVPDCSKDLHIRRYTPEAERIFGFSDRDVGKVLTRLPLDLDLTQLERWMLDVMRDVAMRNEQLQARDGKSYKLRITPYRTLEKQD